MDTRQLGYILAIAEEKNLSRAAERSFITQSALSQQLAKLKKEGLPPLFTQKKREMLLTDAGKIYVNGARAILKLEKDAREALQNLSSNRIRTFRISIASYLKPLFYIHALPALRHAFPQADIKILNLRAGQARLALETGETDLAFFPTLHPTHELFSYTRLQEDELVLAHLPHSALKSLPFTLPEEGTHLRGICDHALAEDRLKPHLYVETNDLETASRLALLGECASVLPRSRVTDPDLEISSFGQPCYFYVVAACRKNLHLPLIQEAIREMGRLL